MSTRARAVGIGGVFFRAKDPAALQRWYVEHLGLPAMDEGSAMFNCAQSGHHGTTVWAPFERESMYFGSLEQPLMMNFRVDNLDALLEQLAAEGVTIVPKREEYDYGSFAWIVDPEGNRVELWQST